MPVWLQVRAESMAEAAKQGEPHGMLSVVGLPDDKLAGICSDVLSRHEGKTVCQLANYLFPQGRVVSGHKVCMSSIEHHQKMPTLQE